MHFTGCPPALRFVIYRLRALRRTGMVSFSTRLLACRGTGVSLHSDRCSTRYGATTAVVGVLRAHGTSCLYWLSVLFTAVTLAYSLRGGPAQFAS